jgi:carbamoyltransferase
MPSPLILGLNSTHPDSAAVLMNEKGIIAAIAEERINRKKHCGVFPALAIAEVLRMAGATPGDITDISLARDPLANKGAKLAFIAKNPRVGLTMAKLRFGMHREASRSADQMSEELGISASMMKATTHQVEHHLAHVTSAFFWSGFEKATAVTVDGAGDFATLMIARCEGNKIEVLQRCHPPHSMGVFYSAISGFLGFLRYGEEYKVMGLSAYGEDRFAEQMKHLLTWDPKKGVQLNPEYFLYYQQPGEEAYERHQVMKEGEITLPPMWSPRFVEVFGQRRERGAEYTQRDRDLACSMQRRFEKVYLELITDAISKAGHRDLVMAGGCALNGVANGIVVNSGVCDRFYCHPAAGDDGTGAGAALHTLHCKLGLPRTPAVTHAYWGTSWTDDQVTKAVDATSNNGIKVKRQSREQLIATAVDALSNGKIVGWFQGREEWGPRALGNRSILCHPGWPDMKAILNARIKNREPFRPFAPTVLAERMSDCFEGKQDVPFMNIVYKTRPEWRQKLSATNHEDNTGRVQTVSRSQNEMYYDLISAFNQKTGTPVLLNTSFNENEPIVHTPEQAIACFARTKMDCLGIGPFWLEKSAELASKAEQIYQSKT